MEADEEGQLALEAYLYIDTPRIGISFSVMLYALKLVDKQLATTLDDVEEVNLGILYPDIPDTSIVNLEDLLIIRWRTISL